MKRFWLKWLNGEYKVSLPNIGNMEVVDAKSYDDLEKALAESEKAHEERDRQVVNLADELGIDWSTAKGGVYRSVQKEFSRLAEEKDARERAEVDRDRWKKNAEVWHEDIHKVREMYEDAEAALAEKDARIAELEDCLRKLDPRKTDQLQAGVDVESLLSIPTGAKERIEREAIKKHEESQKFRIRGFRVAYASGAADGTGLPDVVILESVKDGTE